MPRPNYDSSSTTAVSCPLVINFADDATQWIQSISAAVLVAPEQIEVQFVGGCMAPPFEIIALRNALLGIPSSIRLVTTALASLPALTCAAWLVGDERRIARDAVIWIPDISERILRNDSRSLQDGGGEECAAEYEPVEENEEDEEREPARRRDKSQGRQRLEWDLRSLAAVLNEWFPSWEFKGSCLTFDDLVVWGVVKPEWGFGGRGVRHRGDKFSQKGEATVGIESHPASEAEESCMNNKVETPTLSEEKCQASGQDHLAPPTAVTEPQKPTNSSEL